MSIDTPSDAAKRKACELANQIDDTGLTVADWMREYAQGPFFAFALYIDEVDRVAREVEDWLDKVPCQSGHKSARKALRSLMLPVPPDPDEELARGVAQSVWAETGIGGAQEAMQQAALATIKRLRADGRLT